MATGHDYVFGLPGVLDLDGERGIGTFYQVALLAGVSAMLWLLHRAAGQGRVFPFAWKFLSVIFAFLALDEFSVLHEKLMALMGRFIEPAGLFYFAWVIPYGVLVLVLGAWFLPKLMRVPESTRNRFIVAGACYVGGALGMEMLGGWRLDAIGGQAARPEFVYEFITSVEEGLEMAGLVLMARALLYLLFSAYPLLEVRLER